MENKCRITRKLPLKLFRSSIVSHEFVGGRIQTSLRNRSTGSTSATSSFALHYFMICLFVTMVRLLQYNLLQPHLYFSLRPVVPALVADSGVHQFWLGTRFHEFQVAETIVYFNVVFVIEFLHVLIHPCPTATNQFDCCKTCLPDKDIPHLIRPQALNGKNWIQSA